VVLLDRSLQCFYHFILVPTTWYLPILCSMYVNILIHKNNVDDDLI